MLKKSFLFNVLMVLAVIAGLLFIFFQSLNWLTNHGKETKVPKLTGKKMKEAVKVLKSAGFTIVIDSAYQTDRAPLEVIYQEPEAGAVVKMGRTIFLTVNRKTVPTVPMPNLVNLSFRNAMLTMQSYRLVMGDTTYRPDIAAGSVLEQWYKGRQIRPGESVPYGSRIDLVVGEGLSDIQDVPNLIGMRWEEAKMTIESLSLSYNVLWEGPIVDSMGAIVYKQEPESLNELDFKNSIPAGDMIDVYIMQRPSQELLDRNQPGSAKLIGEDSLASDLLPELPSAGKKKDSLNKAKKPGAGTAPAGKSSSGTAAGTKAGTNGVTPVKPGAPTPPKNQGKNNTPVKKPDDNISGEFE